MPNRTAGRPARPRSRDPDAPPSALTRMGERTEPNRRKPRGTPEPGPSCTAERRNPSGPKCPTEPPEAPSDPRAATRRAPGNVLTRIGQRAGPSRRRPRATPDPRPPMHAPESANMPNRAAGSPERPESRNPPCTPTRPNPNRAKSRSEPPEAPRDPRAGTPYAPPSALTGIGQSAEPNRRTPGATPEPRQLVHSRAP